MKAPLSAFAIVGLLSVVALLWQHSTILMRDRDSARAEASTLSVERDALKTHEQELNAALVTGEKNLRALVAQHEKAVEGIRNAKPNDCTDAPVAADIDRILREQTAASLGYLPRAGKRIDTASAADMGRENESGLGAILLAGPARCVRL